MKGLRGPTKSQPQSQLSSIVTPLGSLPPKHSQNQSLAHRVPPLHPPAQPDQADFQGLPWGLVFFFLHSDEFFWEFPAGDALPHFLQTGCGDRLGLSTLSGLLPTWEPRDTPKPFIPSSRPKGPLSRDSRENLLLPGSTTT